MKLLDSNILIYAVNAPAPLLDALVASGTNAVASVSRIETYGYSRLSAEERSALDAIFAPLTVLPLDDVVIERAIALRQEQTMGLGDAIIAATALVHGLTLVTRNVEDFRHITGLDWSNPFNDPEAP